MSVRSEPDGIEWKGRLHRVDLAGSERVEKSGVVGEHLREAQARALATSPRAHPHHPAPSSHLLLPSSSPHHQNINKSLSLSEQVILGACRTANQTPPVRRLTADIGAALPYRARKK